MTQQMTTKTWITEMIQELVVNLPTKDDRQNPKINKEKLLNPALVYSKANLMLFMKVKRGYVQL